MSTKVDWQFQCSRTTCLPFATVNVSNIENCQVACLAQVDCQALTFFRSSFGCELFANISNQNNNLTANMDTVTMIAIDGTRIPLEPTTTTTSTTLNTTTINPCTLSTYRWNTTGITILNSSQMTFIEDLYFDSDDTLYISDEYNNDVVWKLLKNATTATVVAGQRTSYGSGDSQLHNPQGLYLDSKNNMYVADYQNSRIQKYVNGSTVGITIAGVTGSAGSALNQLNIPRDIVIDSTDTYVYIADDNNNRIIRFQTNSTAGTNGEVVAGGAGAGNTITQLNQPWGIHYLPTISNYLYIINYGGHSVMRWIPGNSSGEFIAGIPGTSGSTATTLSGPTGIKLDSYLNMFVVDCGNSRVQMFCQNNQTGITIAGTGVSGSSATQLRGPRGIAFDSSMNLYVADTANNRVQKFVKL
ncbi:unnamed protein product [Adineta steineri]|uniref:Apple domain-containing protein n=1 Tax=Adineta steineri TaxID=433720 RepID=A0A819PXP9_9BILA|nr:unnamed protein product [Adineta steineri]